MLTTSRSFFSSPQPFEFSQNLTRKSYESLTQIAALNVQIAQTTLIEQTQHWQSLLKVQRLEDFTSLLSAAAQPITSQANSYNSYNSELYQIANGMGQEWKNQFGEAQTHWDRLQSDVGNALKNLPVTAQVLGSRVKRSLTSANEAMGALQKFALQASDAAQANLLATAQSTAQSTVQEAD